MIAKNKTEQALSEALEIEFDRQIELAPYAGEIEQLPVEKAEIIPPKNTVSEEEEDFALARNTFRELIQEGKITIDHMKEIAKQGEHPRAFEVYSTLLKTISDATNDLLDMHKKRKVLKETKNSDEGNKINVDKAVFVGTTAELLEKIKGQKNEDL